ncbi:sigma-54-dependent transcriptional response regulator [Citrifermentans bemidjiense Bem]|uniref:Sigma-54-dependent transcriptional response regulator n=1 Tax=Citrifermentans bemidjiense (strain ATCC BAA-1014 / DSM 16622 / JCM 12645 / Bem) TaxID=404380 RepID=B5EBX7_CITBB|nr:sigma-54 dependent transcriptional regulator [Citrifermentans bemidjiense]ACH39001.1 sigma-54-dependent transcriptional response regulator [Citrifermentans bemidjiense Bem]
MTDSSTRILIIDDERDVCTFFSRLLSRKGYQVVTAASEPEALSALEAAQFSVALVDLKLPDTDGITLLEIIKSRQPACEVIIMTGYSTVKTAVAAMQLGAYEYLEKPFDDIDQIEQLVGRAAGSGASLLRGDNSHDEWAEVAQGVGFRVGSSPSMKRMVSLAYKVAGKDISVLIQGKTGTGKEVLARFIHAASCRAGQPFIPVNCGALPENLLEGELFGHEKGAFTGANQTRRGIFELANNGTLLLDEIGDATPQIQVKLLRVLETGEFMRVGGERPIRTDVRVIAATNVDLEQAIAEKSFREDLFYRLNVVRLEIPSLSARSEDIPLLAEHFVHQINRELKLAAGTLRMLQGYAWPGNIRELANVMRRAVVICNGDTILPEHLGGTFLAGPTAPERGSAAKTIQQPDRSRLQATLLEHCDSAEELERLDAEELNRLLDSLRQAQSNLLGVMRKKKIVPALHALKDSEAETIKEALAQYDGNITEAARALGIARNTLYRKIKELGLPGR